MCHYPTSRISNIFMKVDINLGKHTWTFNIILSAPYQGHSAPSPKITN